MNDKAVWMKGRLVLLGLHSMSRQKLFLYLPYQQMNKTEICLCATFQTIFRHPLHTVFVFLCFHINIFLCLWHGTKQTAFVSLSRNKSIEIFIKTRNTVSTVDEIFFSEKYFMQRQIGKPGEKAKGSLRLTFDYVLFEKASLSWVNALPKFTSSSHHSCGNGKEHKKWIARIQLLVSG